MRVERGSAVRVAARCPPTRHVHREEPSVLLPVPSSHGLTELLTMGRLVSGHNLRAHGEGSKGSTAHLPLRGCFDSAALCAPAAPCGLTEKEAALAACSSPPPCARHSAALHGGPRLFCAHSHPFQGCFCAVNPRSLPGSVL